MQGKEYMETQIALIHLGKQASRLNLDGFLNTLEKARVSGPLKDPELYRKAQANIEAMKKLAHAAKEVVNAHEDLFAAVLQTTVKGDMSPPPQAKKES